MREERITVRGGWHGKKSEASTVSYFRRARNTLGARTRRGGWVLRGRERTSSGLSQGEGKKGLPEEQTPDVQANTRTRHDTTLGGSNEMKLLEEDLLSLGNGRKKAPLKTKSTQWETETVKHSIESKNTASSKESLGKVASKTLNRSEKQKRPT